MLERVKRLTRDGFILGDEARLNPAKLGAGLLVFVEILLDRTVHDVMDTFRAAVQVLTRSRNAIWWPAASTTCSRPGWPT